MLKGNLQGQGEYCVCSRDKKGMNNLPYMEPRKLRSIFCLPSWESGYSTVLMSKKKRRPTGWEAGRNLHEAAAQNVYKNSKMEICE